MSITPDDPLVFRKLDALAKAATFPIYVGTVKEGDAVVIPPGSVFANINFGGRFSRAMWDVFTPRSVEYALMRLAPLCRAIGAVEVFEMKAMAYYGLLGAWERLQKENDPAEKCVVLKDVAALVRALEVIVREDTADAAVQPAQCPEKNGEKKVCQRCGCNLFSRGYQCSKCAAEDPLDGYVCIECVAEGRDCGNSYHSIKDLTLMEFFPLVECTNILDLAVVAYKTVNTNNNKHHNIYIYIYICVQTNKQTRKERKGKEKERILRYEKKMSSNPIIWDTACNFGGYVYIAMVVPFVFNFIREQMMTGKAVRSTMTMFIFLYFVK